MIEMLLRFADQLPHLVLNSIVLLGFSTTIITTKFCLSPRY